MRTAASAAATAWVVTAALCGGAARADGGEPRPADWVNNYKSVQADLERCAVPPALATEWDGTLQAVARRVARLPGVAPAGWVTLLDGSYLAPEDRRVACKAQPLTGVANVAYIPQSAIEPMNVPGKSGVKAPMFNGEAPPVWVWINRLPSLNRRELLDDGSAPAMFLGGPTGKLAGQTVYNDAFFTVSLPGRKPVVVPAPLQRVVKARIVGETARLNETLANQKTLAATGAEGKDAASALDDDIRDIRGHIERLKKMLTLPAAQLQGPAWLDDAGEVLTQPGPNATQASMPNPEALDAKLPRSAAQFLVVSVERFGGTVPSAPLAAAQHRAGRKLIESTDWAAVDREVLK
jgi:hypothetical protein